MIHFLKPDYVKKTTQIVRITGLIYLVVLLWNFIWVIVNINKNHIFISLSFVLAIILITISGVVVVINNWDFMMPKPTKFRNEKKPMVAILIPTYSESVEIVINTLKSVSTQIWPKDKRVIVVSDDAYNKELKEAIESFSQENNEKNIFYYEPHRKDHPERRGKAKSGNLNSALLSIIKKFPEVEYVETRDADDLVGSRYFLSCCLEMLTNDPQLSFVQTIKQCNVGTNDPFSNQESIFYHRVMPTRYAANAVFPCGSGLVWRLSELKKINWFPHWNLVEDLHSGFEILKLGGKGAFLPIVGAIGQIAPEDIPNFYKQRGTWALDTLRLFYYKNPMFTKGLTIRQKLHFFELEFSYLLSFAMCIFIFNIVISLVFGIYPISVSAGNYFSHFFLFALVWEIYNIARARGIKYSEQWRARQIWLGLMPVFMYSAYLALKYGSVKKPKYVVTRKFHSFSWYWKEVLIHKIVVLSLLISVVFNILFVDTNMLQKIPTIFWALFFIYGFYQVIKNSWYGVKFKTDKKRLGM